MTQNMTGVGLAGIGRDDDVGYAEYLIAVNANFQDFAKSGKVLFKMNTVDLFGAYLNGFPEPQRQHYNCHACHRFIEQYGDLVTIDEQGRIVSFWRYDDAPAWMHGSLTNMLESLGLAIVEDVFYAKEKVLGQPLTNTGKPPEAWRHLSLEMPSGMRYTGLVKTPFQAMAEKKEDFKNIMLALDQYTVEHLELAVRVLKSDQMYRSEKVLGAGEWLLDLKRRVQAEKRFTIKRNLAWRAIALAPAGFCHPRSSMISTLLDDIEAGHQFDAISARFAAKMHPLQYQRPQAAPSDGTIAQAEQVIAKLAAENALKRRFARIDEMQAIWRQPPAKHVQPVTTGGVFGHLKTAKEAPQSQVQIPAQTMTWVKFRETVLPVAEKIEAYLTGAAQNISTFVTAVDPTAPAILQWDFDDRRNPVSWWVWHGGSAASQYGLKAGWVDVPAVSLNPCKWRSEADCAHQGNFVSFLLSGACETRTDGGLGLFPEILRSEFHGIRSVIERYSRTGTLSEEDNAIGEKAVGLTLNEGRGSVPITVRVTAMGQQTSYKIDRWD